MSENKRIGLFATNKTVSDSYTDNLISQFAGNCEVHKYADSNIVSFIENKMFETEDNKVLEFLVPAANFFIKEDVDHVVLGCTHFLFITDILENLFSGKIKTIDSREGVSRQTLHILGCDKARDSNMDVAQCANNDQSKNSGSFYVTSSDVNIDYYKKIADRFMLKYSGII